MPLDQEFVIFIAKSLVTNTDDVSVDRAIDEKGVLLTLHVNQEDLGKVIGKGGANAQAIRTLLRGLGLKTNARIGLKVADDNKEAV